MPGVAGPLRLQAVDAALCQVKEGLNPGSARPGSRAGSAWSLPQERNSPERNRAQSTAKTEEARAFKKGRGK